VIGLPESCLERRICEKNKISKHLVVQRAQEHEVKGEGHEGKTNTHHGGAETQRKPSKSGFTADSRGFMLINQNLSRESTARRDRFYTNAHE
jgi:hypothetical protein